MQVQKKIFTLSNVQRVFEI